MAGELIAGRYRLHEPLGRGAMSSVWQAEDTELHRQVAVKILAPRADRARFEREARAAAALSHPNICALYDFGETEGRLFMVLEYLPNGSLDDRLRNGSPLDDIQTRGIAGEIAAGLAHAHSRGLVHRDLKPGNVLFDAEDRAKIADFGIARIAGSESLTEAGTVLGTASTISPEQASGLPAGPPSDVYSFGVILFRMLTGRLPFASSNAMELVRMHRDDPAPAVATLRPDAPHDLATLAGACLQKDPAARPSDGEALVRQLSPIVEAPTALLAPQTVETEQTTLLRPPRRRRVPTAAIVLLVLALLGAGLALAIVETRNGSRGPKDTTPSVSLPVVPTAPTTQRSTAASSTAPTTTAPTTTAETTTAESTTRATTTAATTTAPTTAPTTTAQPSTATTAPTISLPTTTETVPTTAPGTTVETTVTVPTTGP